MTMRLKILLELAKARIALLSTTTMIAGYLLAGGSAGWRLLFASAGVFMLASGACALNQVQERDLDLKMERTRGRPLPSGRLIVSHAIAAAMLSTSAGALIVLAAAGAAATALGMAAVGWYNGVYTPLKRVTPYAAVPGAVVGAIPPAIGWAAAGGELLDARLLAVSFFFFVWQVPHFWLLLLHSTGKDCENAGLPCITRTFSSGQMARITFSWMSAAAAVCVLIPVFGGLERTWVTAGLMAAGVWLLLRTAGVLRAVPEPWAFRRAFASINLYAVFVISILSLAGLTE